MYICIGPGCCKEYGLDWQAVEWCDDLSKLLETIPEPHHEFTIQILEKYELLLYTVKSLI